MTKVRRKNEVLLFRVSRQDRGILTDSVYFSSTRHAQIASSKTIPGFNAYLHNHRLRNPHSDTMYKLYEVDPNADTLLIVPHPTEPFAPWDQDEQHLQQASGTSISPPATSTNSSPTTTGHDADAYSSVYAGILRGTARPTNIYARIASSPSPEPRPETRIKVSSRHLSLASRHFRDRFRHLDRVDDAASDDGRVHVSLPGAGHDPAAVILVMDILHGRGRKVPRAVGLETLARVAVVVDTLRCLEAVEVYAERWFEALLLPGSSVMPAAEGEYGRDLVLWLYAAYVFRRADIFQRVTRTAVLRSDGPVRSLGLNVREGIISESIENVCTVA